MYPNSKMAIENRNVQRYTLEKGYTYPKSKVRDDNGNR